MLLLLSRFSRVQLCAIPQTSAHQAPPSLGFSRQEHWSGLPFPSPMHESEKWKWSCSVSVRLFVTSWTAAYQAPLSLGFTRQVYWSGLPLPSLAWAISMLFSFPGYLPRVHRYTWYYTSACSPVNMSLIKITAKNSERQREKPFSSPRNADMVEEETKVTSME